MNRLSNQAGAMRGGMTPLAREMRLERAARDAAAYLPPPDLPAQKSAAYRLAGPLILAAWVLVVVMSFVVWP